MPRRGKKKREKRSKGDGDPDQGSANTLLNPYLISSSPPMSVDPPESSDQSLDHGMNSPLRKKPKTGQSSEQSRMEFSAPGSPWSFNAPSTASVDTRIASAFAHTPTPDLVSTPFADSTICVAVDVSISTKALILAQEVLVISTISQQLSQGAQDRGRILPWSSVSHPILRLMDSAKLTVGNKTDPSVICSSSSFATALRDCSLWFLLTDGVIGKKFIERFANGIAEKGFHGTACVIILFGQLPHKPMDMNISIGLSVFAVAPNCLFLFHDIKSGKVYVVQCKGCYTRVLPETWETSWVDDETDWEELQEISYEQLAQLHVPKPIKLDKDDVALPSGRIINMQDLYRDDLDPQSVKEIFDDDDSMKSVLLVSATRGHSDEFEVWLEKQKSFNCDGLVKPRPDIHGWALSYTQQLLNLMKTEHTEKAKLKLQNRLQGAHVTNWKAFRESIDQSNQHSAHHNLTVQDSIDRVNSTRSDSFLTPMMLMPVSSRSRSRVENESSSDEGTFIEKKSPTSPEILMPVSSRPRSRVGNEYNPHENTFTKKKSTTSPEVQYPLPPTRTRRRRAQHDETEEPEYLYTPNYRRRVDGHPDREHRGDCALCGVSKSPLALLLKKPNPKLQTAGLPPPGSQAKFVSPLAMENFPETDIISWFVCCDPCSYFVTSVGEAPANEEIVGAIILTNLEDNRRLWKSALVTALENRFADEDVELVFVAILNTTLRKANAANDGGTKSISSALSWAISQLPIEH